MSILPLLFVASNAHAVRLVYLMSYSCYIFFIQFFLHFFHQIVTDADKRSESLLLLRMADEQGVLGNRTQVMCGPYGADLPPLHSGLLLPKKYKGEARSSIFPLDRNHTEKPTLLLNSRIRIH